MRSSLGNIISLSLLFSVAMAGSLSAQEWTRFRGPNGSGETETPGIPTRWKDADYRWRVELPGSGHSSPVVWGDQVYVTSANETDATQIVQSLRTTDGKVVWRKEFASKPHGKNSYNGYAASTPTVDQQRVYVTWATPETYLLVALDRTDGRELWRRDFGPFVAEHGFGASPILVDDLVIVPNEQNEKSSVVAVDRSTGKTRWTAERQSVKAAYSTPIVYQAPQGPAQIILTSIAHGIYSLDARSGAVNWELPVLNYRTVGSPMIAAGLIFASGGEGGGGKAMFAVRPGDPATKAEAKVAYQVEGKLPYVPTSVAYKDLLFLWSDQGIVTCLDAPTGKAHWQQKVGGRYFSSPIRVQDRIYCTSLEGEVVVLAAAREFKVLGRTSLSEGSQSTPAVSGGVMYLRTKSHLMAIGGK